MKWVEETNKTGKKFKYLNNIVIECKHFDSSRLPYTYEKNHFKLKLDGNFSVCTLSMDFPVYL